MSSCHLSVGCLFIAHVLWLNGTPHGVGDCPLNRATVSSCRLLIVTCLYLQRFGRNFLRNVSDCSHHPGAPNYYRLLSFDNNVDITCIILQSPPRNRFFSATGSRTLAFGHRRYGQPTQSIAGFLAK